MSALERKEYYRDIYPVAKIYEWLNHSPAPKRDTINREFTFVLDGEMFVRYLSYERPENLEKDLLRLNPERFEIGPYYNVNPRDRKMFAESAIWPVAKELTLDIDMDDYDSVRTCCQEKQVCVKCWQYINVAMSVIDAALRDDFGFQHILWVFSGRRGAHCWVSDDSARLLDDSQRKALLGYLTLPPRLATEVKDVKPLGLHRPLHPHLARSFSILKKTFEQNVLVTQDPWRLPERAEIFLRLLRNDTLSAKLRQKWGSAEISSLQRWKDVKEVAQTLNDRQLNPTALLESKQDIILFYMYPRLDVNVSTHTNHLLKAPFCIHPATGNVCVPIDPAKAPLFDPKAVPKLGELVGEREKIIETGDHFSPLATSLGPYIEYLTRHVADITQTVKRTAADALDDSQPDIAVKTEAGVAVGAA